MADCAGKPKILIVEDEAIVAADLEDRLAQLGYHVVGAASSAAEAMQLAATTAPDLVLMDIMIKGELDGTQTAQLLRQKHHVPVIYLTAFSNDSTLERAKSAEPFGYLLKPFNERELRTNIEMALYKHRMEQERDRLLRELQAALAKVKTLSGLLPMCCACKKIRDDAGYWQEVEQYISQRSEANFSHSFCADCLQKLYPDVAGEVIGILKKRADNPAAP